MCDHFDFTVMARDLMLQPDSCPDLAPSWRPRCFSPWWALVAHVHTPALIVYELINHEGENEWPGAAESAEVPWCGPKPESSRDTFAEIHWVDDGIICATMNISYCYNQKRSGALAGVAQWIEHCGANQRVTGSVPSQGTSLGCRPGPQWGTGERQPHIDVSFPFFLPPFPSF